MIFTHKYAIGLTLFIGVVFLILILVVRIYFHAFSVLDVHSPFHSLVLILRLLIITLFVFGRTVYIVVERETALGRGRGHAVFGWDVDYAPIPGW